MALFASDVKLSNSLGKSLTPIYQTAKGSLSDALGKITNKARMGQQASGRVEGEYTGQELGRAGEMGQRGIDDSLAMALGNASYQDFSNERDHQRQMALAKEVGDMNRPSKIQEIARSLALAGESAPAFKSLYDQYRSVPRGTSGSLPSSLSLYGDKTGYARYQ